MTVSAECAYCAEVVQEPEVEHVFPESWYPDGTNALSMLKVPSCSDCNRQFGAIEERLVRSLIMGLHPGNPTARGVRERVFNGMNWLRAKGKSEVARTRDARARMGAWNKFKGRTQVVLADDSHQAFPTAYRRKPYMLQNEAGLWIKGMGTVSFDPADLNAITEKFAKGVYYLKRGIPLPSTVPIDTQLVDWQTAQDVIREARWPQQGIHPSFTYWGNVATEDPLASLWFFRLWGEYMLSCSTAISTE